MKVPTEILVIIKGILEEKFPWLKPILEYLPLNGFVLLFVLFCLGGWIFREKIWRFLIRKKLPHATSGKFAIAVAHIEGDDAARTVENSLLDALISLKKGGIEILRFDRITKTQDEGKPEEAIAKEQKKVRSWLKKSGAHVMLWGRFIGGKKQSVRLHITARDADESRDLRLDNEQVIELPVAAKVELETAIRLQVLSQLGRFSNPGGFVAEQIAKAVTELRDMIDASAPGETKAAMQNALGIALLRQGEQLGDINLLSQSTEYFKEVLTVYTRERAPLDWARAQNNLGNALTSLGERESGTTKLAEAVTAYKNALQERTRERVPLDWAMTQSNLGAALRSLGERENSISKLEEAVIAYKAALSVFTEANASFDIEKAKNKLDKVQQIIARRKKQ